MGVVMVFTCVQIFCVCECVGETERTLYNRDNFNWCCGGDTWPLSHDLCPVVGVRDHDPLPGATRLRNVSYSISSSSPSGGSYLTTWLSRQGDPILWLAHTPPPPPGAHGHPGENRIFLYIFCWLTLRGNLSIHPLHLLQSEAVSRLPADNHSAGLHILLFKFSANSKTQSKQF